MKRIGELLEFLKRLLDFLLSLKVWLPTIVVIVLSVLGYLYNFALINVQIKLPLLAVIGIVSLGLYPIAKFFEHILKRKKPFHHKDLLWIPARFSFAEPIPICPKEDCGCTITFKAQPPPSIQFIGIGNKSGFETEYTYIYKCPIHGQLKVPNIHISELIEEAKIIQNKKKI